MCAMIPTEAATACGRALVVAGEHHACAHASGAQRAIASRGLVANRIRARRGNRSPPPPRRARAPCGPRPRASAMPRRQRLADRARSPRRSGADQFAAAAVDHAGDASTRHLLKLRGRATGDVLGVGRGRARRLRAGGSSATRATRPARVASLHRPLGPRTTTSDDGRPAVSVPVLSKAIAWRRAASSRYAPPLTSTPSRPARAIALTKVDRRRDDERARAGGDEHDEPAIEPDTPVSEDGRHRIAEHQRQQRRPDRDERRDGHGHAACRPG